MTDEPGPANRRTVIDDATALTEATARRLIDTLDRAQNIRAVRRIRQVTIVSAVLGAVGAALFIVGVERAAEDIPVLSNAYGSVAVGLLLLAVTGTLLTRLGGRHDDDERGS